MLNVEMVDYVHELIQKEIDERLNSKSCEYHSASFRSFEELCAMETVAHIFCTLMVKDWPEDVFRDYINDMLNF